MSKLGTRVNSILKNLLAGKTAWSQDLIRETYNYLRPVALLYAEDKNDCEDILQEAYLRVFKYIHTVDLEKDGFNWMCKIVQNVAFDFAKKPKTVDGDFFFFLGDLDEEWVEKDALLAEISKLSESDQQLIYLYYWQDKPIRDIASIVGMKKSTVHKRLKELEAALKKNLK